jgi:arylsulfatase A-like enzyme
VYYGIDEKDYLTDNISRIAQEFIKSAKRPFFVEIATYAPHDPYRPAYRDENAYSHARVPRTPPYAARPDKHAPDWMRDVPKLTPNDEDLMDADYRLRAQSVRAIDKMIYDVRATLASAGLDKDTYVFFTSDNGFHMGEYSFPPGKMAPFDTDIHVPLVIAGPNIKHQTITEIAQTVDLAPTFIDIGGGELPPTKPDGQSLLSLLQGKTPDKWRSMALVEHHGVPDDPNDPDNDSKEKWDGINPPDYLAIRSKKYLYVEFYNNTDCPTTTPHCEQTATEWAYYDLTTDPDELKNVYQTLSRAKKHNLKNKLADNKNCGQSGEKTCWLSQQ